MIQNIYKRWISGVILFPLVLLFIPIETGFTQSSPNYQIKKFVFDQGGAASQSTNHTVVDAVGQPSPVGEATSINYIISSGFLGSGIVIHTAVDEMDNPVIPIAFKLFQNYPNPFNPMTEITFGLPEQADVKLTVYNILGQVVNVLVEKELPAGQHAVKWDGGDAASGVYFYRIEANDFKSTKRMVLMK